MAIPNPTLISALRSTADRLNSGAKYEWGHMGRCNCGHLVQTLTKLTDREIVETVDHNLDEWTEHAKDYCDLTGSKVDSLFDAMKEHGFYFDDMVNLEYLKDKEVLKRINKDRLYHNVPTDVAQYMHELANLLEEQA